MMTRNLVLAAAGFVLLGAGTASAQAPFVSKPIDTNRLLVQPSNVVGSVTGRTASGIIRTAASTAASVIEENGFVKTINNFFGRRATGTRVQPGFSTLPLTGSFPSSQYRNSFTPRMPLSSTYGVSPNVGSVNR